MRTRYWWKVVLRPKLMMCFDDVLDPKFLSLLLLSSAAAAPDRHPVYAMLSQTSLHGWIVVICRAEYWFARIHHLLGNLKGGILQKILSILLLRTMEELVLALLMAPGWIWPRLARSAKNSARSSSDNSRSLETHYSATWTEAARSSAVMVAFLFLPLPIVCS